MLLCPWKNKGKCIVESSLHWPFTCWKKGSRTLALPSLPFCQGQWSHRSVNSSDWVILLGVVSYMVLKMSCSLELSKQRFSILGAVIPSSCFVSNVCKQDSSRTRLYFFVSVLPDEGDAGPGLCQPLPAPANVLFHSYCVCSGNCCATVANDALLIMPEGKAKFPPSSVHAGICFPLRKIFACKSSVYIVNEQCWKLACLLAAIFLGFQ